MRDHDNWMHIRWLLVPVIFFGIVSLLTTVAENYSQSLTEQHLKACGDSFNKMPTGLEARTARAKRMARLIDNLQAASFYLMMGWALVWGYQWLELVGNALHHWLKATTQN